MSEKKYYKYVSKKFILLVVLLLVLSFIIALMKTNSNPGNNFQLRNLSFCQLGNDPKVYNITPNTQYFKNGDLIKLRITCDQANYTIFANFSAIDDQFLTGEEQPVDYRNGTYLINYSLSLINTKADGAYRITINTTNRITGFSILNETVLNLDNTIPYICIRKPQNGAFLRTDNITIEGVMNATGSQITHYQVNDTRFGFLTNMTWKDAGNFVIVNKSAIKEGLTSLRVSLNDSVNLINSTIISFTLDNTLPYIKVIPLLRIGNTWWFEVDTDSTFSPTNAFEWNMTEFSIIPIGESPIGKITDSFILTNSMSPLPNGTWTLKVTIRDSVNLSYSSFRMIDFAPPVFEAIIRNITDPEYYQGVNISILNPQDLGAGLKSIILVYWVENITPKNFINITDTHWAELPPFRYQTTVRYQIELTDRENNINVSKVFTYTISDKIAPILGEIHRTPTVPNQNTPVNITIDSVADFGSGIGSVFLNYSIDGGVIWHQENITVPRWGVIENQPQNARVIYQIIAFDKAGNEIKSSIQDYTVQFYYDYGKLLIFLIVIGSIVALSTYSGKKIYSKRKLRKLRLEYLTEKEKFNSYTDLRLEDLNLLLNDIESVEANLNKFLKFRWVPHEGASKSGIFYRYRMIKEFIGITQFSNELNIIKADWMVKKQDFDIKFHILDRTTRVSKREIRFFSRIDAAFIALGNLNRAFRKKYPLYSGEPQSNLEIEYPLEAFDQKLAKIINKFQTEYNEFAKEFDQLLISRKSKLIEDRLNELDLLFRESDEWLKNAEEWSKILPLPKDRGYNYLLKLKGEQYNSIRDEFQLRIEKLRAELSSSIEFAQDFLKWNYDSSVNKLKKFEKAIYEDIIRFISIEDIESSNIDDFIQEKFDSFNSMVEEDKRKVNEFYESHLEFHLQEVYNEWTAFIEEIPINLERIRDNINKYNQPLYRLFKLIKGVTTSFYKNSAKSIEKLNSSSSNSIKPGEKFSSVDELFSKIIWEVNRIDNEIKKWIDLLPFDLETQHLIILLKGWSEIKEEVFEQLNKLGKEKKIYKCEIMHEVLDPFNTEVWECSNCGAIACMEHLEKWYHRKQSPECFKCGKTSTFRLKTFIE